MSQNETGNYRTVLHEFEDSPKQHNGFNNIIVLLVCGLMACFWLASLINYFSVGFKRFNATDFIILPLFTLLIGFALYFLSKKKKVAWFLLSIFLAFLLGIFVKAVGVINVHSFKWGVAWRPLLVIIIFILNLSAVMLLFHNKTKQYLVIPTLLFIFCIACAILVATIGYLLV